MHGGSAGYLAGTLMFPSDQPTSSVRPFGPLSAPRRDAGQLDPASTCRGAAVPRFFREPFALPSFAHCPAGYTGAGAAHMLTFF